MAQRMNTSGYSEAGASHIRRALKGFLAKSGSPTFDINFNNSTLRQRSRMLYMSSPVATSAINTNRTHVVGPGLELQSSVDRSILGISEERAAEWQLRTDAEFRLWAESANNCDALGVSTFAQIQQVAIKNWLMSGDVFCLIQRAEPTPLNPYTLRLHLIEADRISTPLSYRTLGGTEGIVPLGEPGAGHKVTDGVEIDENGHIVAYYIASDYPGVVPLAGMSWQRVLASGELTGLPNILHITETERCEQYRGVPYLAQCIESLLQMRRYTEAELMAAIVQSFFTAWIKTTTPTDQIPMNEVGAGEPYMPGENPGDDGGAGVSGNEYEYEMGPGMVMHLEENEDVVFGNPNIPTAGFDAFLKALCRQIGAALEIPYDILLKEFNSSYSASRGALMEAWESFKMRRAWLVTALCKPVYELFLSEAVAIGRINAPGFWTDPLVRRAWCGASWRGPIQGHLDPVKETRAAVMQVEQAIKTRQQVTREQGGGDWNQNVGQVKRENSMLGAANAELNLDDLEDETR